MKKMKSNIIRGKREMYEVMNEVTFDKLPDSIIKQLAIVGITNATQYNRSSYRLSTTKLFKAFIEKFIMYSFMAVMFMGAIVGAFGHIDDLKGTQGIFIITYFFMVITLMRVYDYYYTEMLEPWDLVVEKLTDFEKQVLAGDYDEE